MAAHPRFIPETARRIADPLFTKDLYLSEYHLGQFVEKREQLLLEVIQGLDANSKAALGLIYMRKDHLESPITPQGSELQALERLGSTLGECITALGALNGSLVTLIQIDDQPVWRFKHPTIGDAYAATLAFSPDLLEIFLSGSSTENLTSQVTGGNVGVEKAVVVPKSLFPMMIARLREFSTTDRYKVQWLSTWDARWTLYEFLANRCSREFLALYLAQDPDILKLVSEPRLSLSVVPEVDLALRLHEFGLLPEESRRRFIQTVSSYAIDGVDVYALSDAGMRSVFTDSEFDELVATVRTDLLPKLAEVRMDIQNNYDSSESPDEHMQNILESFRTLKGRFREDEDAIEIIERETYLAKEWISEAEPPELKMSPRTLGTVEPSEAKHGTRSIFDDIDDSDA
jgi:hypothetical protein